MKKKTTKRATRVHSGESKKTKCSVSMPQVRLVEALREDDGSLVLLLMTTDPAGLVFAWTGLDIIGTDGSVFYDAHAGLLRAKSGRDASPTTGTRKKARSTKASKGAKAGAKRV